MRIVAEAFRGVSAVARHRLVYAALGDMLKSDIHALAIEALAPPAVQPGFVEAARASARMLQAALFFANCG